MNKNINPITVLHEQYEKLVDDIYYLGNNVILRMNVTLAKKSEDGRRYYYHNEFMYKSNKYIDINELITLRRSFEYFLTLENIKYINGEKESIMIRVQDIINIRYNLNIVYQWFISKKYKNLFAYSKGNLIMLERVEPVIISGLALDKKIIIEPTIIQYDNDVYEGVRLFLNSNTNYIDIKVDRFMGFYYIINTIDMYQSAQLLLNYNGRPDFGNNIISFNNEYYDEYGSVEVKQDRQIANKLRKKSFFEKIDDI